MSLVCHVRGTHVSKVMKILEIMETVSVLLTSIGIIRSSFIVILSATAKITGKTALVCTLAFCILDMTDN